MTWRVDFLEAFLAVHQERHFSLMRQEWHQILHRRHTGRRLYFPTINMMAKIRARVRVRLSFSFV